MTLNKYKTLIFGSLFILIQISSSFAQKHPSVERPSKTITIDLKNIESEVSNVFRIVAHEINKIDMREVGIAVEQAGREIGDIQIIVNPETCEELSEEDLVGTETVTKRMSKSYTVSQNDKLSITNQYGNVDINVWDKNEIKVDVEIKAFESSEKSAENLLETVKINESRQNNLISYKTVFEKSSHNSWTRIINGKEERRGLQVNYVVYMPSKNPLDITNRYGAIALDDMNGPVNIVSAYGKFNAGKLNNPANSVKVSYGAAQMESYSNGNLSLTYGSLNMTHADKMNASVKYSRAKITKLTGGGNFDIAYASGFAIDQVDRNVKLLNINSAYSGLSLGIDQSSNLDYDVTVSYAGFHYKASNSSLQNQLTGSGSSFSPTKNYKGSVGKGSEGKITIKSSYGGVKFL